MVILLALPDQVVKRRWIIILIFAIAIVLALSGLQTLEFSSGASEDTLPSDMDIVKDNDIVESEFGSKDQILVLVEINDISEGITDIRDPEVFEAIQKFSHELEDYEFVRNVRSYPSLVNQYSSNIQDKSQIKEIIERSPHAREFINSDYSSTIIMVQADVENNKADIASALDDIKNSVDQAGFPAGVEVSLTGSVPLDHEMTTLLQSDMQKMVLLALSLVLGALLYFYRDLARALVPLLPMLISVIITIGILSIIGMKISPPTVAVAAMLIGMGIDYGAHITNRYYEERGEGKGLEESASISISKVGKAIIGTSVTTIVGFASIYISRISFMKDLSLSLVLGILIALISALTLLPITIIYEEKIRRKLTGSIENPKIAVHTGRIRQLFVLITGITEKHYKKLTIFFVIATLFMSYGGTKIIMSAGTEDMLPQDSDVVQNLNRIESQFGSSDTGTIVIKATGGRDVIEPDLLKSSKAMQNLILANSHNTKVDSIDSFSSLVKEIPDSESEIKQLIKNNPRAREYFNDDYSILVINLQGTFSGNQKEMTENIGSIKENMRAVTLPAGYEASLTGNTPIDHKMVQVASEDMTIMSTVGSIGIILVILLLFRSFTDSVIMGAPMIVGALWTFGFVGYMGIEINQFLIGFLSIILGLAIDFGMHITHRFREADSIQETLTSVGPGILTGGLTTIFGYTALTIASLPIIKSLGVILVFGIAASMFAAFFLSPSLIKTREAFRQAQTKQR